MASREIIFEFTGAVGLLAVGNGDHFSDELFSKNKRQLHSGVALAVLRSQKNTRKYASESKCRRLE